MKKISKFAVFFLSVLFILSACQTSESEIVPEYDSDTDLNDLDGYTVKWAWMFQDTVLGYVEGSNFADMAIERKKQVEKDLNCNIELIYNAKAADLYNAALSSGQHYCDILTGGNTLRAYARNGYFMGLSSLLDLENTYKWGSPLSLTSMAWIDDVYAVIPNSWPELFLASAGYPIVVNGNLVSKYGLEDPREFVENNEWNWDKYEECLHNYTVQDGENTVYGHLTHSPYFGIAMFLSNGVSFAEYVDGAVVSGFYTDKGRTALERAKKIKSETCADCFHPEDNAYFQTGIDLFTNNVAVLFTTRGDDLLSGTNSIIYKLDNIGIIPFPSGPDAKPGVYSGYNQGLYYSTSITVNSTDVEASATILSEMYEPFEGYETKEQVIDYMANQIFFDEQDARIYYNILENTEYGYYYEGGRDLIDKIFVSSDPVSSILESYEDQYTALIEDYMTPIYKGIVSVYGE